MSDVLFWMEHRHYPTPVLINGGEHWVVITGFVDHQGTNGLILDSLVYNDPQLPVSNTPGIVGTFILASAWYDYAGPWGPNVSIGGTWKGKYVAVLEPPKNPEKVIVVMPEPTRRHKLLPPDIAQQKADQAINDLGLRERPEFGLLRRDDVDSFEPMLVLELLPLVPADLRSRRRKKSTDDVERRARRRAGRPVIDSYYYIVPIGIRTEHENGVRLARACVLVDAYEGRFREASAFARAVRYLPRKEALDIAAGALPKEPKTLEDARMTLMFQPSTITQTRSWPFWRVKLDKRTLYVNQSGRVYGRLEPGHGGN
jgi:hypothetical protein